MQGIDVSRYQGVVDWQRVRAAGKQFAIARAGYGRELSQEDPYFVRNYNGITGAGLAAGCYWYSYADTTARALEEANTCLTVIGNRSFPMGVWFDQEYEPGVLALSNAQRTAIIRTFLNRIREAGFITGLYCSADWLRTKVNYQQLSGENLWIAQYASSLNSVLPANIWQYSESGRVSGVQGNVDLDELLIPLSGGGSGRGEMPPLGTETLHRGSRGYYVCHLQFILTELGYNPGAIDSIFGAQTEAAVMEFQRDAGLTPDGLVGPQTRAALERAWQTE